MFSHSRLRLLQAFPLLLVLTVVSAAALMPYCIHSHAKPTTELGSNSIRSHFNFTGYMFFYDRGRVSEANLEYRGLIKHPVILTVNGTRFVLVYNCTKPNDDVGLLRIFNFNIKNINFKVFVYKTRCSLSYPILYLVNGTVDMAGSKAIVTMNYSLVFGEHTRLEGAGIKEAPPSMPALKEIASKSLRYVVSYIQPAYETVASANGTLRFVADPSNSTLILDAPADPCEANGKPLTVGGLSLWLEYVPDAAYQGGLVCVGAPPKLLAAVRQEVEGALWSQTATITVQVNAELVKAFDIGQDARLLRALSGRNNTILPPTTSITRLAIIGGKPEPKMIPGRYGALSERYLACYGPSGLPKWNFAPILVLPEGLSRSFGVDGVPLLEAVVEYQEGSPGFYDKRECGGLPWDVLVYLALSSVVAAAAIVIVLRVRRRWWV